MRKARIIKSGIALLLFIAGFIIVSYIVQSNTDFFTKYIQNNIASMIIYVIILIISAVIAPIDPAFLMPVAIASWGWLNTAILSLVGWTLGSALVFVIARKFGLPLIQRFVPLKKVYKYEKLMHKHDKFFGIIFLRLAMPIDIISYVIALFTTVDFIPYFIATLIGYLPLALLLAFLGTLSFNLQIISFVIFVILVLIFFFFFKKIFKHPIMYHKKKKKN